MKSDVFSKKTKDFFSSDRYCSMGRNLPVKLEKFPKARKFEFTKFLNFLNMPRGARLIELGAGFGEFTLPLLNLGYEVTAVDVSKNLLSLIRQEAQRNKLEKKLKTVESDFRKPLFLEKFDAAFCISTFHLLAGTEKERIAIFANLVKSVKPGGTVLVIEPNPLNPFFYPFYWLSSEVSWEVEKHFIKSTEANLKRIFFKLNLKNIKILYVGFLPLRLMDSIPAVSLLNGLVNKTPILRKLSSFIYIKGTKTI